ncbi:PadR family transcriptional regulator [Fodinicola acaciae]|uniref:PadR family transcriptional regulator n=1 Tax=Fodinicola acaciae TaxID=2681555 RepID=UPI0013D79AB8|nr:PadR family transcriptional regulator [Fodinicola acaciae]
MAKRRKVANLLALAVLSTLTQRPMHPYEMASILRARDKHNDMPIKWGSLYTVVQNLEKHGFVEATENVRDGGRPERTIYRITDDGRAELTDWVRELVAEPEREHPRFVAALSVLGALSPDEVIDLLRQRLRILDQQIANDREALQRDLAEVPRLFLVEDEFALRIREAEAAWVGDFLRQLTDGSFPDVDGWRAFHRTGEIRPDLAALAERGSTPE